MLAKDMIAGFDNPPFDRSPVDGYACKAEDITDASESHPVQLTVLEEIDAGQYSRVTVEKGQAVRIMTGAAIPKGCDCCVRQEDTDYGEETVRIFRPTGQWQNYCYQGENFKNRTVLLKKGDKIGFIEAGILASMGVIKVKVYRRVRAAVLTTGDEVMAPGKRLIPGKIYDCNQGLLAARMKEFGAELVEVAAIEDRPQAMTAAGEVMALDWGITLQCDTTGKEDASSVGVRSHFIHPVLPGAETLSFRAFSPFSSCCVPEILTVSPEDCKEFVKTNSEHGGADAVLEVAGAESTFKLAWECARPNAIVAVVALYDKAQMLPLPDMYGKNLTFKTGGVDGCDCEEILKLISEGKINTEPLITHTYPLNRIEEAYELFENKRDGVIKVAVEC